MLKKIFGNRGGNDSTPEVQELWIHIADDAMKRRMVESFFRTAFANHPKAPAYKLTIMLYADGDALVNAIASARLPCHAVLTDFNMPAGDGLYVIQSLRALPQMPPTVMVTGDLPEYVEEQAQKRSVNMRDVAVLAFKPDALRQGFAAFVTRILAAVT